jgi:hypothetical protein
MVKISAEEQRLRASPRPYIVNCIMRGREEDYDQGIIYMVQNMRLYGYAIVPRKEYQELVDFKEWVEKTLLGINVSALRKIFMELT